MCAREQDRIHLHSFFLSFVPSTGVDGKSTKYVSLMCHWLQMYMLKILGQFLLPALGKALLTISLPVLTFIMDAYRKQNKLFVQWETDELSQTSTHKQTHTSLVPLGQLASLSKEVYVCLCSDAWQSSSVRCLY